jgi:flagellar biosynthesis protein FliQ
MSTTQIITAAYQMMTFALMLAAPFLLAGIAASLVIGLLQATTRMNDLTLSFVPRFFAFLLVLYISGSWAIARVADYIEQSSALAASLHE